jgi:hypothetical protein
MGSQWAHHVGAFGVCNCLRLQIKATKVERVLVAAFNVHCSIHPVHRHVGDHPKPYMEVSER